MTTHLFDGLNFESFESAVAIYHRVLQEAQKVEGPAPNICPDWEDKGRDFDLPVVFEKRDGYRLETFDFLDFRIEKGNCDDEYCLLRQKLFPMYTTGDEYECVVQVYASKVETAAEVAESVLGFVMQVELLKLLDTEACADIPCRVYVKDITKIGGYDREVPYRDAWKTKREMENFIVSSERGNAICSATIEVMGLGYIVVPPFGKNRFVPTGHPEISDEMFEAAVTRYPQEREEIRTLWGHIARHTTGTAFEANRFDFEDTVYVACQNPNAMGRPEWTQVCRHYVGSRSWVKLLDAYRSGLLAAWAESLS